MNGSTQPQTLPAIEGQLNAAERGFITKVIIDAVPKPEIVIEVGTWLGGGSTLHLLRALQSNGTGRLWGVEAYSEIYEKMVDNIRRGAPDAAERFTPLFGFSTQVIPKWLNELPPGSEIDAAFLDGGDNPLEQIEEFRILAPKIRTGGVLMAHDARMRKGKWLGPYVAALDNWETSVHDLSIAGLFHARKLKPEPSPASQRAAERKLARMRLEPKELAARLLPSRVCGWILTAMPKRLARRLTLGPQITTLDSHV